MSSPGVRISGGSWRGRKLEVAHGVRPTEGRVREALFSIWQDLLPGARFLDLFAGSGAVGLEALSRGASSSLLVEKDPRACRFLTDAARTLAQGTGRVWRGNLPVTLGDIERQGLGPFDLVFADPPYAWTEHQKLLAALRSLLAPEGSLAIEHSTRVDLATAVPGWQSSDQRSYGETTLSFFELAPPVES
jgi:16S rRNA (guanine966-N2)-methyltransferase